MSILITQFVLINKNVQYKKTHYYYSDKQIYIEVHGYITAYTNCQINYKMSTVPFENVVAQVWSNNITSPASLTTCTVNLQDQVKTLYQIKKLKITDGMSVLSIW